MAGDISGWQATLLQIAVQIIITVTAAVVPLSPHPDLITRVGQLTEALVPGTLEHHTPVFI